MSQPDSQSQNITARAALDPVMVASKVGDTFAVWQVETDPDVQLGDFSGAWIIGADGIRGFAAGAEWIPERKDQQQIMQTIIRYPVIPVDSYTAEALEQMGVDTPLVDWAQVESNAQEAIVQAKKDFSAEFPDKKQPAWGSVSSLQVPELPHPIEGLDEAAAQAAAAALAYSRGLRAWIREWVAFDKLRIRRLGPVLTKYGQPATLPF